jgi:S1-C subfamily serine protease
VTIQTFVEPGMLMSTGSGFIYSVSDDNKSVYILTNAHVIDDMRTSGGVIKAKIFEILYHNNVRVNATLLAKETSEDIAILKAEIEPNNDYTVAKLGDSDSLMIGEEIYAIGSPYQISHNNTMTRGIVSNVDVMVDSDNDGDGISTTFYLTQIDAAMSSGNSGGPLFNMKGEVVGINVLKIDVNNSSIVTESMNFALRINSVIKIANSILETGIYSRPYIGILATSITGIDLLGREEMGISKEITTGLYINGVYENSPAAGVLEAKTVITKINGVKITSFANFTAILLNFTKGDSIELEVVALDNSASTIKTIILG